jgi:hypothetical protein
MGPDHGTMQATTEHEVYECTSFCNFASVLDKNLDCPGARSRTRYRLLLSFKVCQRDVLSWAAMNTRHETQ